MLAAVNIEDFQQGHGLMLKGALCDGKVHGTETGNRLTQAIILKHLTYHAIHFLSLVVFVLSASLVFAFSIAVHGCPID